MEKSIAKTQSEMYVSNILGRMQLNKSMNDGLMYNIAYVQSIKYVQEVFKLKEQIDREKDINMQ